MNKISLFNNITNIYKLNYSSACNVDIYIKRDDLLDFAFGGNKVRLYEYIAHVAKIKNVSKIVTYGAPYSNHIRVTAATCNKLGISCDLIILSEEESLDFKKYPNLKLCEEFHNVHFKYCPLSHATDFIDNYQHKLAIEKVNYLWVPGGGHMPEAAFGYVDAGEEIKKQINSLNIKIDAIFLPCGTGTTQAGLIYAFSDTQIPIIGFTVARSVEKCKFSIRSMLDSMNQIRINPNLKNIKSINVIDNKGLQYGQPDLRIEKTIRDIACSDGIYLDPIYNAKSFFLMLDFLKNSKKMKSVLYINTGGIPNIFL